MDRTARTDANATANAGGPGRAPGRRESARGGSSRGLGGLLPRPIAFWMVAAVQVFLLFASSAPSPLYVVYQAKFHFSATTLTGVFAVYVLALMAALVFAGSLSDHLGRRPVVIGALLVEIAAMVAFAGADGVAGLYVARVVQGLATGVATSAISAALIDLQHPEKPRQGTLINSVAPTFGLAAGALGTGLLVQYAPDPTHLIFLLLLGIFAVGVIGILMMAEPVDAQGGALRSLRPQVGVPRELRGDFFVVMPCLVAVWALGGLYLSLGPSVAVGILHVHSHLVGGLVIFTLTGVAALTSVVLRAWPPRRAMFAGQIGLILGIALTLIALAAPSTVLFFIGTAIAGVGFGVSFLGAYGKLVPLAAPNQRGAVISSLYIVGYLAFSLPAIAAGTAVTQVGLHPTINVYGAAVIALAAIVLARLVVRGGRDARTSVIDHDGQPSASLPPPGPCTVPPCAPTVAVLHSATVAVDEPAP